VYPSEGEFLRGELPFSPGDIDYLPDEKREITEEDIEAQMKMCRYAGSPNAENPEKLRAEAISILKRKNISKAEAEEMLRKARVEYKKVLSKFLENHYQVEIIPPDPSYPRTLTVWVDRENFEKAKEWQSQAKVVISRHPAFVEYIKEQELVKDGKYIVIPHATDDDVKNKDVITSGLPLHLAAMAKSVTVVSLNLPPELRGKELTVADMKKYTTGIKTFIVEEAKA